VDCALAGEFFPIASEQLLDELSRILRYDHLRSSFEDPDRIVELWREACVVVTPTVEVNLVKGDNHLLEAAVESEAEVIVTGDHELLELGSIHLTAIVTVRQFLDYLDTARASRGR